MGQRSPLSSDGGGPSRAPFTQPTVTSFSGAAAAEQTKPLRGPARSVPPRNLGREESVLGGICSTPDCPSGASPTCCVAEAFYLNAHREILPHRPDAARPGKPTGHSRPMAAWLAGDTGPAREGGVQHRWWSWWSAVSTASIDQVAAWLN